MKNTITLLLLLWFAGVLSAQSALVNPCAVQSAGEMPPAVQKALQDKEWSWLKYLLHRGKVVYGSPVNQYLDKILANLLVDEPELKKEITLLVVKSPIVNAYANNKGILLINIGLIAQVSNEAELAFVLAHELIHYVQRHHYMERTSDDNMNRFLQRHFASRDQESEADTKGIVRFYSASNYNFEAVGGAFDVLQYGHLPFDNIRFDRSFVENSYYQFPDKYFLQNVKPISNRDDYLDTLCTHPNIAKRRMAVDDIIAGKKNDGRLNFVQSETLFNEIRDMSRLECINQWIVRHQFAHAFYNAYVLLKVMPEPNPHVDFLYNAMAISMYGMSKHKTNGSLRDVLGKISDVEGEQQGAWHFLDALSRQEFNALALRMLWEAKHHQSDNLFLTKMTNDLLADMIKNFKLTLTSFCDYPMGTNADTIPDEPQTEDPAATNKYGRIKQQKTGSKVKPSDKFKTINYMLGDLKQDSAFVAFVQKRQNELEDAEILDAMKQLVTVNLQNASLLFMEPSYIFVEKDQYSEPKSREGEKRLKKSIEQSAKQLKIDNEFLGDAKIGQYSVAQYNNYAMLYDWIEYVYRIEENIEPYYAVDVEEIAPNCQYLVMTSAIIQPRKMVSYTKVQDIVLSAICFYVSPAHIAKLFIARRNASSYFSVVNLKDGQVLYSAKDYRDRAHCTEGLIHAFMYDCLYNLKKGGNK
ncbi:MAG: M48 family metallopeptidase [Bacteroidales bacterium]|jgi:hypothetical protein|nr:M48 family metallopeptidase [Bacteroidales bacterium]